MNGATLIGATLKGAAIAPAAIAWYSRSEEVSNGLP
jgi:hypothetical protein